MDLDAIMKDCGISRRKVKLVLAWLRAHKYLPPADRVDELTKIKECLGRGHLMSLGQFVILIDKPDLIKALGAKAGKARSQIAAMNDPIKNAAPRPTFTWMEGCANRDAAYIEPFSDWVQSTIPAEGCTYHYLALRLYYGAIEFNHPRILRRAQFAFLVLRGHPGFAGWFTVTKNNGRSETFYHKPKFDL